MRQTSCITYQKSYLPSLRVAYGERRQKDIDRPKILKFSNLKGGGKKVYSIRSLAQFLKEGVFMTSCCVCVSVVVYVEN